MQDGKIDVLHSALIGQDDTIVSTFCLSKELLCPLQPLDLEGG